MLVYIHCGKVSINLIHDDIIFPSTDFSGDFFWYSEVVGQRRKAMAQAVHSYLRQVVLDTSAVYILEQSIGGTVGYRL